MKLERKKEKKLKKGQRKNQTSSSMSETVDYFHVSIFIQQRENPRCRLCVCMALIILLLRYLSTEVLFFCSVLLSLCALSSLSCSSKYCRDSWDMSTFFGGMYQVNIHQYWSSSCSATTSILSQYITMSFVLSVRKSGWVFRCVWIRLY